MFKSCTKTFCYRKFKTCILCNQNQQLLVTSIELRSKLKQNKYQNVESLIFCTHLIDTIWYQN